MGNLWKKLMLSAIISIGIGVGLIIWGHNITISIGTSIIAAYIFYVFMEFIPALNTSRKEKLAWIVIYRHLQLLLSRLDDIILEAYKISTKEDVLKSNLSISDVYDPNRIKDKFQNLSLGTQTGIIDFYSKPLTFYDYILVSWNEILTNANFILSIPIIQSDPSLVYEITYLIYESRLSVCLRFLNHCDLSKFMLYNFWMGKTFEDENENKTCTNIIKLHSIANSYYVKLAKIKSSDIIFKPNFYNKT